VLLAKRGKKRLGGRPQPRKRNSGDIRMTDRKSRLYTPLSRRSVLRGSLATSAGIGALSLSGIAPLHFVRGAFAEEQAIGNFPKATSGSEIVLGFNVPQTGPYA